MMSILFLVGLTPNKKLRCYPKRNEVSPEIGNSLPSARK